MPRPELFECPICSKTIPFCARLFMDYSWTDEDGMEEWEWTECCDECFDKYA